jgi:uncharacterized protein YukE
MSNFERIIYDPYKLEPLITDLKTAQANWESLLSELNGVVATLNDGFIAKTQEAFNGVHESKRTSDYALLSQLLIQMPQNIQSSLDEMNIVDDHIAQQIREFYGV